MIRVFISQPMKGKTVDEIIAIREKAIKDIKKSFGDEPVEVINSYFENYNPEDSCVPLKYLAKSLELLADADCACFVKGWEDARGCRIEHEAAVEYGIACIEEGD